MMEIGKALKIMEMDGIPMNVINTDLVKRQYKKMALKLHPDKNGNTPESTVKFQELSESYTCLLNMVSDGTDSLEECKNDYDNVFSSTSGGYFDILRQFIMSTLDNIHSESIIDKIKDIVENCQNMSVTLFENIDRDTSITIFQFLNNYKDVLHVKDSTLEKVKKIIQNKFEELEIYTIDPTLHDLLSDNVYLSLIHI